MSTRMVTFERVRVRWIPVWVFGAAILVALLAELIPAPRRGEWEELLTQSAITVALGLWALRQIARAGLSPRELIGPRPTERDWHSLVLVLPLMPMALAGLWALWLPLSYAIPDFVREYVLKMQPIFLDADAPLRTFATVVIIVLVAPIVEEVLFRGILLHRFATKWSPVTAIVVSSLIFGILHADILGHAIFGVVLSLVYVRTGSLWLPIAIHMLNNGLAVAAMALPWSSSDESYSLAEFRDQWYVGAIALAVALPLLYALRDKYLPPPGWRLPVLGPTVGPGSPSVP